MMKFLPPSSGSSLLLSQQHRFALKWSKVLQVNCKICLNSAGLYKLTRPSGLFCLKIYKIAICEGWRWGKRSIQFRDCVLRLSSVADALLMVWVRLPVDWIDSVRSRTIDIIRLLLGLVVRLRYENDLSFSLSLVFSFLHQLGYINLLHALVYNYWTQKR